MYPRTLIHAAPKTGLQGKTSLHYTIAAALLHGRPTMATYTDAAVAHPGVEALRQKLEVVGPPHLSEAVPAVRTLPFDQPATIIVDMADGSREIATVQFPKGMPQNPIGEADLLAKFADCAATDYPADLPHRFKALLDTPGLRTGALLDLLAQAGTRT